MKSYLALPFLVFALVVASRPARGAEAPAGVDVQARGPIHEAFAEPTESRPAPSPVVAQQPPEPVAELPPEQKPAGDDVIWIPGYWSSDDETNDFLWVSGFWRVLPPGKQWVAGNWQQVEGGWQWSPGFWADADQGQVAYLPPPPPSIDAGPSTPATDATQVYVPGVWVWRQARYFWRPGFFVNYQPNWVWVPAHYVWTPAGYVFVEGYWDRPLAARGLLFAPVRFTRTILVQPGYTFVPQYVVQPDFLLSSLFVRPSYYHYYFGDYFPEAYVQRGFVPWVDYRIGRHAYDPNFGYYRAAYAGTNWDRGLRDWYTARRDGTVARPPHTLVQQTQLVQNLTTNRTENVAVNKSINVTNLQNVSALAPLTQVNNTRITHLAPLAGGDPAKAPRVGTPALKLAEVPKQERVQEQKAASQLHSVAQQRRQHEAKLLAEGGVPVKPTDPPKQAKLDLPRPTVTKPVTPDTRPAARPPQPPAPPTAPKHEERPIPPHQPVAPARPPQPQPKTETKPPAPKVEPKAPAPTPKVETKPAPTPTPKAEPKPVPAPAPKVEPKAPAPTPKVEPKAPAPAPKVEPKAPAPTPAPKVEPKAPAPAPKVEPAPKTAPKTPPKQP
jgi:hypothetical protein